MINDAEMLNYILQSAEMGCQGVKNVRAGKQSMALDSVLVNQMGPKARPDKLSHSRDDD